MMVRLRFLSFSFSYFFFHSSAVSSRFTDTVFFIVLALKFSKQHRHVFLEHKAEPWTFPKLQHFLVLVYSSGLDLGRTPGPPQSVPWLWYELCSTGHE